MRPEAPPYGKARIGLVEPRPGETDAQAIDVRREGQLAGRRPESYQGVPPVKKAPWEWYLPLYFWLGGIAAGSWLAAAAEDLAGENERGVVRAGRYLAVGGVAAGTLLLVVDLGRPDRFLNMLRVVRPRSAMSLGSWGLVAFGGVAGAAAALQAAEDGLLGDRPRLRRLSRGWPGRTLHLAGLPFALFVAAYTGALLGSTATPAWARRRAVVPPLFLASSVSTGLAAVSAATTLSGSASPAAERRLARAEAASLAGELALAAVDRRTVADLPSARHEPRSSTIARWLTLGAGMALPLALSLRHGFRKERGRVPGRGRREGASRLLSAALALAGGLALRLLATDEGYRSGDTPGDTWTVAGLDGRGPSGAAGEAEHGG